MKLNHLNLTVADVPETRRFLEKYLGLRSMEGTKDDATFVGLLDDGGFVLTLMQVGQVDETNYPASFHIGFLQESEVRVTEIYQRLKADGFDVEPPRQSGQGLDLYFLAPGGFTIQVSG